MLDPWITHSPQVYPIEEWSIQFSGSSQYGVRGSSDYENQPRYPTGGWTYTPTGDLKLSAEENAFIRSLPVEKQEWLKKMSEISRKAWLEQMLRRQRQNATLSINSPLDVYLTDDAGHVAGFMQGNLVDDLPEVSFRRFIRADGDYWTEVEYPADRNYRVAMVGTGDRPARVFSSMTASGEAGATYQYDFLSVQANFINPKPAPSAAHWFLPRSASSRWSLRRRIRSGLELNPAWLNRKGMTLMLRSP